MNKNTLKLTTGAMFIALFTMLLIINRQTGMMLEELIFFILPIPMVAFTTKYGWKSGIPVMIGMVLMSFLFGTVTTIFYAASQCIIGLVLGNCFYTRADATKTIMLTVVLSAIANLLCTVIMAPVFGFDLAEDIAYTRNMLNQAMAAANVSIPDNMFTDGFMMRMMVISMTVMGMMQGYIIYVLSTLILKRMRFVVPKPKSLYEFFPPKWTGYISILLAVIYMYVSMHPYTNEVTQTILQSAGICGTMYLMFMGFLALVLLISQFIKKKLLVVILSFFLLFSMNIVVMILGFAYIVTDYHKEIMDGTFQQRFQNRY